MAKDGREWIKSKESDRCEGRALLMERGEHLCRYNVYIHVYVCMYHTHLRVSKSMLIDR